MQKGSQITLFITGEGQTTPAGNDGALPAAGAWPQPVQNVVVSFGASDVAPAFVGLIYAGVTQINVTVPPDAPPGNVLLVVKVGGAASQAGSQVAIQ